MKTDRAVNLSIEVIAALDMLKDSSSESYDSVIRRKFGFKPRQLARFQAKYPIADLDVEQEVVLPWERDDKTSVAVNSKSMADCVRQHERRTGKQFWTYGDTAGLRVRRIR